MIWNKYTITTTNEAEALVTDLLLGLGIEGIEVENSLPPTADDFEAMFIDPQPELLPDEEPSVPEGVSLVSFYLRVAGENDSSCEPEAYENDDSIDDSYTIHDKLWTSDEIDSLFVSIQKGLAQLSRHLNLGDCTITENTSDEDDWRNRWMDYYQPLLVGDILIKPAWSEVPEEHKDGIEDGSITLIEMNPGTAFGTGSHETTRLCVDGLSKYLLPGQKVLDIGAGSGILGLCALAKGASLVMSTEIDPDCEHIMRENAELNPTLADKDNFRTAIGNIIDDEEIIEAAAKATEDGSYDIIVSNILAPVIETLAGEAQADRFAHTGSIFITSGIIDTKEQDVVDAFRRNPNWEVIETLRLNEWSSVVAKRF